MSKKVQVIGMEKIMGRMKKYYRFAGKGAEKGYKKAGLVIQEDSLKEVPRGKTGNLAGSIFQRFFGNGFQAVVRVGFSAAYAVFVHEDLTNAHGEEYNRKHSEAISDKNKKSFKDRGKNQKAKFLEDPVKNNRKKILNLIRKEIKKESVKIGQS